MKKFLSAVLCLATLFSFAVPCFAAEESVQQQPAIIDTVFPADDVVIADIIATQSPYNADNTGKTDATSAFRRQLTIALKTVAVRSGCRKVSTELQVTSI